MDLDNLERTELQKLAKKHGIKANQKTKKLLSELKKVLEGKVEETGTFPQEQEVSRNDETSPDNTDVDLTQFITDDEESLVKSNNRKEDVKKGLKFKETSMLSDVMTDDNDDSLMVNCTRMDPEERVKDVSFPSAASTPMKCGKTPAKFAPAQTPVQPTTKQPALETPQNNASISEEPEESTTDQTDCNKTPENKNDHTEEVDDKTFSLPKKKVRRRAPVVPPKEVAIVTSYDEWKESKETHKNKKVSSVKRSGYRRSPRIKAAVEAKALLTPDLQASTSTTTTSKSSSRNNRFKSVTATGSTESNQKVKTSKKIKKKKNWMDIHAKNFSKLESIDDHEKRKKERALKLLSASKKALSMRLTAEKSRKRPSTGKAEHPEVRKKLAMSSLVDTSVPVEAEVQKKPMPKTKTPKSTASSSKPIVFKPSVTDVKYIKTSFSKSTNPSASKSSTTFRSKLKAPEKKLITFTANKKSSQNTTISKLQTPKKVVLPKTAHTSKRQNLKDTLNLPSTPAAKNKSLTGNMKHPTPFKVGGNSFISTPSKKFNLQASLKKPLAYQPHKGPLKEFVDTTKTKLSLKDRTAAGTRRNKAGTKSRAERRQDAHKSRSTARNDLLMKRRALN